jgi:hypothetical protein
MRQPHTTASVVCIKTREQSGEAEQSRGLYYNGINAIDPCVALEDANASLAPPSERAASRPTEAQVGGG